jgi:hypothetical protein
VQLEDAVIPGYLDSYHCLLLTYRGMKPLTPDVHRPLADWVKRGGLLVVCDDDGDPFNSVREWWNTNGMHYATPRQHLFEQLGLPKDDPNPSPVGKGQVVWIHRDPAQLAAIPDGDALLADAVRGRPAKWKRGPVQPTSSMERNQLPAPAARPVHHRCRLGRIHRRPAADAARPVHKSI